MTIVNRFAIFLLGLRLTDPDANRVSHRESRILAWTLALIGVILALTVVPGVFIIDEPNYLSTVMGLRHGTVHVPGTEGLTPSRELVAFDPEDQSRSITSTPVSSLAPPLYSFLALPFSWFGWPSLFYLNILGFLITTWCVYTLARDHGATVSSAAIGAALFALGGFSLEYAYGMWPHMVSVALTTGAFLAATRARTLGTWRDAALAGVLAGWAVGIREQNIVIAAGIGAGILFFTQHRFRQSLFYVCGLVNPLLLIAWINFERLGSFHPIPKAAAYATQVQGGSTNERSDPLGPAAVLWAKIVDYRTHPTLQDPLRERLFRKDPSTGVPIVGGGVVKKALLQSAPWIGGALVLVLAGWSFQTVGGPRNRQTLAAIALLVVPVFAMIGAAGFSRSDGLTYNQRYLLELVPLFAAALGIVSGSRRISLRFVAGGAAVGIVAMVVLLGMATGPYRYSMIATIPLLLTFGTAAAVIVALFSKRSARVVSVVLGLAVGWSFLVHVVDDVRGSRDRRSAALDVQRAVDPHIPRGAAVFTYWGGRDAMGPLMLTKDVLLLDAWADGGVDAPMLTRELMAKGRRVLVRIDGFSSALLDRMSNGLLVDTLRTRFPRLIEIRLPDSSASP